MSCEHSFLNEDGFKICTFCGLMLRHVDPTVYSYNEAAPHPKRRYNRHDRFVRILKGLNGTDTVKETVMVALQKKNFDQSDPVALREVMLRDATLKKHSGKLASVFYQLGNQFTPLAPHELEHAKRLFSHLPRCSFIITLPYVLKLIAREDLMCFCKPLSQNMQKKYDALCEKLGGVAPFQSRAINQCSS